MFGIWEGVFLGYYLKKGFTGQGWPAIFGGGLQNIVLGAPDTNKLVSVAGGGERLKKLPPAGEAGGGGWQPAGCEACIVGVGGRASRQTQGYPWL